MNKFIFYICILILVINSVFAITGTSDNYTVESKLDYGASQTNSTSTDYEQRFISGTQPVSQYSSSTYAGRFGILEVYDALAPVVTLNAPADGHSTTNTDINFEYTVSDESTTNCSLILNGNIVATNSSVNIFLGINSFFYTGLSVGAYTWSVNCTDSLSHASNSSTRTFIIDTIPVVPPSGGGGGGGAPSVKVDFDLEKDTYETTIPLDFTEYVEIGITNKATSQKSFNIEKSQLDGIVFLDSNMITLSGREEGKIKFTVKAPSEVGIYTGKIIVTSGSTKKEILIVINVKSDKSLFDISVKISPDKKTIRPGENIDAQISLLQAGIKEKMDVTLNYVIKDFDGVVYLQESESIMVFDQKSFDKEFHTADFPIGDYVLGAELVYPEGVAVASSQFKIKEGFKFTKENIVFFAILFVLIMFIAIIIFLIRKYKRQKQQYSLGMSGDDE
jgi:hypothetical protein